MCADESVPAVGVEGELEASLQLRLAGDQLASGENDGKGTGLAPEMRKQIGELVPAIEKARLYRGRGGEVMRGATARLMEVCASLRMPAGPKAALRTLQT